MTLGIIFKVNATLTIILIILFELKISIHAYIKMILSIAVSKQFIEKFIF